MKKQFAVFGLGSFGESIALELQKLGCEVCLLYTSDAADDS